MLPFTHSLAISLLHSLWQSALLLLIYFTLVKCMPKAHPLFKRNLLYKLLSVQVIASIVTFLCYYFQPSSSFVSRIPTLFSGFNNVDIFIQQYSIWILGIYMLVVCGKMFRQLYLWRNFKVQYSNNLVKPDPRLKVFLKSKAFQFGIDKNISLWLSHSISTPVVFGYFKPVILLPLALANQLSIQQTEALIIHELTHIKQNDFLLNWFLLCGESIYFFNPFIQIMGKMIKVEREKSCDLQVLNFNYSIVEYAESLLAIAATPVENRKFHIGAFTKRSILFNRIQYFSTNQLIGTPSKQTYIWGILTGFLLLSGIYFLLVNDNQKIITPRNKISLTTPLQQELNDAYVEDISTKVLQTSAVTSSESAIKSAIKTKANTVRKDKAVEEEHLPSQQSMQASFNAIPVSLHLNTLEEAVVKEVVVKEENSNGQKVTKVYIMELKDGQWIAQPKVFIKEGINKDTVLHKNAADSVWHIKVNIPVQ